MRALDSLHDQFSDRMQFLHAKRFSAMWRGVEALVAGQNLWLTALGRAWPTMAKRKHAVKAADRLLGNEALHRDRFRIAAAIASLALPIRGTRPIVLVDTMEIRHRVVALTASIAHDGRALPIWSTTVKSLRPRDSQLRNFLKHLRQVLPLDCKPILVTDGGFDRAWFNEIEEMGWDYVGRVRGTIKFDYQGNAVGCAQLHRLAKAHAKDLGLVRFPIGRQNKRRLVLSKTPKSLHRRRKTRAGNDNDNNYKHYRKNVHEPLLVATSLRDSATRVINIYKLRMQIEQSFRDLKCHRWGWSLRHCLTRSRKRLEVLLLLGSLAMLVQHLVGCAAEMLGWHRAYQANTINHRRVLSLFFLGGMILRDDKTINVRAMK